jgi:hypothetical protein
MTMCKGTRIMMSCCYGGYAGRLGTDLALRLRLYASTGSCIVIGKGVFGRHG